MLNKRILLTLGLVVFIIVLSSMTIFAAQKEISLWTAYAENVPVYEKLAEEYIKENPDVEIKVEQFPARSMQEKIAITLPAGTASDIIEEGGPEMCAYIAAGFISRPPAWVEDFVEESVYDFMKPVFYIDGEIWGLPSFVGLKYLYINKKMLEEADLIGAPQTVEQMIEYAKKMTKYDKSGNVTRSGLSLRLSGGGYGIAEKWYMKALAPYGGRPLIETAPGKYCGAFDTEESQKSVQLYLDLLYKYKVDSYTTEKDIEAFTKEETAMFQREGFVIGHLATYNPDLEYIVSALPGDVYRGTLVVENTLFVNEASKHKEIAWDFVKFLSSKDSTVMKFKDTGWNPVRKDVDYAPVYAKNPKYRLLQEFPENYGGYFIPNIICWTEIWTKAGEWLADMFTREDLANDPEKLAAECKKFNESVNQILKEADLYAPKK